jgi:1L-myo-inositol 1-phosphate cytidylyltransferase / CDP-L-myo-inositol myo-inositolphosphotransferase
VPRGARSGRARSRAEESVERASPAVVTVARRVPLPITTAIVLATPTPGASPLDTVAGLPLALRTVLTLQKEGIERVHLVVETGDTSTAAQITADPRVRIPVEVVAAASRRAGLERLLETGAPALVALAEVVVEPSIYRDLAGTSLERALAVAAASGGEPVGPLVASPRLGAALSARDPAAPLDEALRELRAAGGLELLDVGPLWALRADTPEGRQRAVDALFEACRKPVDGLVSRHLNRHISIFISKRLVATPVTPNMTSVATFILAIAAAFAVARGTYGAMLLGAALFQANSILDGVDGELARVRFQHSRTGQWLDTIFDDLSTALFYGGLTLGVRGGVFGHELALCGYLAIGALALTVAQYYAELLGLGSGDFYALEWDLAGGRATGIRAKVVRFFQLLLKKDFFIFLYLALAVVGLLPFALVVALFGHAIALAAAVARNARRLL